MLCFVDRFAKSCRFVILLYSPVSRKEGFTKEIVVENVFRIAIGGTTKPNSTKADKVQIVWGLIAAGFYVYAHKNTK